MQHIQHILKEMQCIQSIRNLFRLKKENEAIKDRIIRDARDFSGQEKKESVMHSKNHEINEINRKIKKSIALNHDKITGKPKRITKCKLFISIYNWEGINYTSKKYDEDHIILQ